MKALLLKFTLKSLVAIVLLSAGSSCNKMCVEQKRNPDCVCMAVYDPVCGCNGVTYSNACEAECVGIKSYTQGTCK